LDYDIGFLYYDYPGVSSDDFLEFYGSLTFVGVTAKASYSSDFYAGSGNAWYYTLGYDFALTEGLSLGLQYGYSDFDKNVFGTADSYTDLLISLGGSLAGLDLAATWTSTNLSTANCGSDACDSTLTFSVSKSF